MLQRRDSNRRLQRDAYMKETDAADRSADPTPQIFVAWVCSESPSLLSFPRRFIHIFVCFDLLVFK